jgi:hypothetical protein
MKSIIRLLTALLLPLAGLQAAKPLNILFFTADDMNYDSSGVCGGPIKDLTPNLDRLRVKGCASSSRIPRSPSASPCGRRCRRAFTLIAAAPWVSIPSNPKCAPSTSNCTPPTI